MKKILIISLMALIALVAESFAPCAAKHSTGMAQESEAVLPKSHSTPPHRGGGEPLEATGLQGGERLGKRHFLLYTPERIAQAKQRMKTDTALAAGWRKLQATADGLVKRNNIGDLDYLSLAYLMTGDHKYSDCIRKTLLSCIKATTWGSEEMLARKPVWRGDLGLAHKTYLTAIGFDAVYNDLTPSERMQIAKGLKRLALDPCLEDWVLEPRRIHSINSMGHNWWTSCACMGGILALSLRNELPEAQEAALQLAEGLPEWFSFAGDVLQAKAKSFDAAGGMYESVNYANFGIQEALQFIIALKNTCPGVKMPEIPELERVANFFVHVCYPHTGILWSLNFGDSHLNITGQTSLMLLYALGYKDPDILWYLSQVKPGQERDGWYLYRPMGLLYSPDLAKAPLQPRAALSQLFSDFGWATTRTSWEKDATMLAVKSGKTWNHSHADANSFILFHRGVDIIKDGGHCWYPNPNYRNYFFQSQAHNVVLFNGKGQPTEQQYHGSMLRGYVDYMMDGGNVRYILANATGPYSDQMSRNFRHFLWIDNVIYVVDDLKTHESGSFEWLWHPNGTVKKQGFDLNITNGQSAVAIRPLFPQTLAQSDFVHDYPDNLYWEQKETVSEDLKGTDTYWSFHLPGTFDRVKGLTAIILKDSPDYSNLPQMERRQGQDWIGLRVRHNGKVIDLYINQLADGRLMHNNSWIEADGWQTDAYMFAVSYDDGKSPSTAKDVFISYGSALRRGDNTWLASLSKLFVIEKMEGNRLSLQLEGQPQGHVRIGQTGKIDAVSLNGENAKYKVQNGLINIKY